MIMTLMMLAAVALVASLMIVAPSNLPGNPGAALWDTASKETPPGQPPMIPGGPEGVIFAAAGRLCVDEEGNLYVKQTDVTLATGWALVTATPVGEVT